MRNEVNKKDIQKVIDLLSEFEKLSLGDVMIQLKMNKQKIEVIFDLLIENDDVINLSSKDGVLIARKSISSFKTLNTILKEEKTVLAKIIGHWSFKIFAAVIAIFTLNELIDSQFDFNFIDRCVSLFSDNNVESGS